MANKQTTAVEWLIEQTRKPEWHSLARGEILEQALAMEREQIEDAYFDGGQDLPISETMCQLYYEHTYGKE